MRSQLLRRRDRGIRASGPRYNWECVSLRIWSSLLGDMWDMRTLPSRHGMLCALTAGPIACRRVKRSRWRIAISRGHGARRRHCGVRANALRIACTAVSTKGADMDTSLDKDTAVALLNRIMELELAGVVRVAHDAGQFQLHDPVQQCNSGVLVERSVHVSPLGRDSSARNS